MPVYHLEITDGERIIADESGAEYRDLEAARRELVTTLALVLYDSETESENRDITGRIVDATGREVCTARLSLQIRTRPTINLATDPN